MEIRRSIKVLLLVCFLSLLFFGCPGDNETDPCLKMLEEINDQSPTLRARLEALRTQGIDVAYPLVSLTVLEQFSGFAAEDIEAEKIDRACRQIEEMEQILQKCDDELSLLESGKLNPSVPRYITSSIQIQDGAFKARVRWNDGTETDDWPVIFNGYGIFESVKRDVELMPDYGMNIVQVEIGPAWILVSEEETEITAINELVAFLDRAQASNVTVNLMLSPHYFPQWAYDKWPEIRTNAGEYIPFSVDSSHVRSVLEKYLRTLIPEIANHPALHSLCLTNEPSYFNASLDSESRKAYNAWLQEEYGTISAVSEAHGRTYETFDDVPIYPQEEGDYPSEENDLRTHYDYYRFNDERFAAWHEWTAEIIHDEAPDIPVHSKFSDYTQYVPFEGVDPELFDAFSQIAGNDSLKYYTENEDYGYANEWITQNMFLDLLRSISGKPSFNSENHLIRDRETQITIPSAHYRNVFWQAAIHGQGASTVWVWERDIEDEETGDPVMEGFTSIMHRPLAVMEHGRTALDLLRLGDEVHAFQRASARIALIYSPTSLLYNYFSGNYERLFTVTYLALNFTGEKIDFITESQLVQGKAEEYQLIFAPGVTQISLNSYNGLKDYISNGGRLVLVGEGNLENDQLNQPIAQTITETTQIPDVSPEELRDYILPLIEDLPDGRPVKVVVSDSVEEPWGVEWLYVKDEGQWLVNLTNYEEDSVTVHLEGIPTEGRIDLLTMETIGEILEITPLAVHLIAVPKE